MARVVIGLITCYQRILSPLLGSHCRFTPSCSAYFKESVEKHGLFKGAIFGFMRMARCHPFHPGGYDPVKH